MKQELANAMLKRPQHLNFQHKVLFVAIALLAAYVVGVTILWMLGGRHYFWLMGAAFPLLILASVAGRLLRSVIVPPPAGQS